jgi:gluconolactonase
MKQSLSCLCALSLVAACSANGPSTPSATGGSSGSGGTHASAGAGGAGTGGAGTSAGAGGVSNGGSGTAGTGGSNSSAGTAGASGAGGTGGAAATGFKCPAGTFDPPAVTGKTATRIAGAPPADDFNKNNYGNVEGPVWIGDSLYFSEMKGGDIPAARILKLTGGLVSVAVPDSGSNGLAVDASGNLFAAVHKDGSISRIALPGGTETPMVATYMGKRFISPNDLAIRSDGTIYFSDPNFQNTTTPAPQSEQRLYWVKPGQSPTVTPVIGAPSQPNGVTLAPDEKTLYASGNALKQFAVMTDGSLSAPTDFPGGGSGDGMVVDCAGNLYVAGGGPDIRVFAPSGGTPLGTIAVDSGGATPTNVAFGGSDHRTLYVTAMGGDGQRGVFSVALNVPGFPY